LDAASTLVLAAGPAPLQVNGSCYLAGSVSFTICDLTPPQASLAASTGLPVLTCASIDDFPSTVSVHPCGGVCNMNNIEAQAQPAKSSLQIFFSLGAEQCSAASLGNLVTLATIMIFVASY